MQYLNNASQIFTTTIGNTIKTASYNSKNYLNGLKAKEALIRSQSLIRHFHEALKLSINAGIQQSPQLQQLNWDIFPQIGTSTPELKLYGELKGKDQDVVFINQPFRLEKIKSLDVQDSIGYDASNSAIVCGVRSQMSSVDKNFDTLMERAIAEAVNLRIRLKNVTLVELYIIPLNEINEIDSEKNIFSVKKKDVNLKKFIKQFYSTTVDFSKITVKNETYMMHATCLLILDLQNQGKIIANSNELANLGYDSNTCDKFKLLQPEGFVDRVIMAYRYNNNL